MPSVDPPWLIEKRSSTQKAIKKHGKKLWKKKSLTWKVIYQTKHYENCRTEDVRKWNPLPVKTRARSECYTSCITVDLHPTEEQAKILKGWCHSSREMYNEARKALRGLLPSGEETFTRENLPKITKWKLRDLVNVSKKRIQAKSREKLGKMAVTMQSLDLARDMAFANYQTCVTNLQRRRIHKFTLPKLKRDKEKLFLKLAGRVFDERGFYPARLGKVYGSIECRGMRGEFDWSMATRDSTLIYHQTHGTWKMYVPENPRLPRPIEGRFNVITLDPGYRTFLTGVSDNHALAIGNGIMKLVSSHQKYVAKIERHVKKAKNRRKILKRAEARLERQVDQFHWKTAAYLTKNYDHVIIGDMSPVKIISRKGVLHSGYKTRLVKLRYGKFRERLAFSAHKRGVGFLVQDESFTSLACSRCAHIREKSSSKHYSCQKCGHESDRDINGARNIYCKHLL